MSNYNMSQQHNRRNKTQGACQHEKFTTQTLTAYYELSAMLQIKAKYQHHQQCFGEHTEECIPSSTSRTRKVARLFMLLRVSAWPNQQFTTKSQHKTKTNKSQIPKTQKHKKQNRTAQTNQNKLSNCKSSDNYIEGQFRIHDMVLS